MGTHREWVMFDEEYAYLVFLHRLLLMYYIFFAPTATVRKCVYLSESEPTRS